MVVRLREVREDHRAAGCAEVAPEVRGHVAVGEVAVAAEDPLLQRPRVRAFAEHAGVVVGLDEDGVALAEALGQRGPDMAEVGGVAQRAAAAGGDEGHRSRGVVRDRDPGHGELADRMRHPGGQDLVAGDLDRAEPRRGVGPAAAEQAHPELPGERGRPAGVVGVLVGEDDRGERGGIDPRGLEALGHLAGAQAGVDEQPRGRRLDHGGVARAARPEDAETHPRMLSDGGATASPARGRLESRRDGCSRCCSCR